MATNGTISMVDLAHAACRIDAAPEVEKVMAKRDALRAEMERLVSVRDLAELDRIIDATGREQERIWMQLADSETTLGILYRQHRAMRRRHAEALRAYQYATRGEKLPGEPEDCP